LRTSSTPLRVSTVLAFVISLSCALLGCSEDLTVTTGAAVQFDACQPLALAADDGATAEQLQAIQDAVDLWNRTGATRLTVPGAAGAASGADTQTPSLPIHFQRAAAPFHGLYDDRKVQIFINQDLVNHPQVVTIAHEVGHALGLVHVPTSERASLMNSGNLKVDPTAGDVAALAALWGGCAPAPAAPAPTSAAP